MMHVDNLPFVKYMFDMQWCQTNFSSIEDIENCQNRGGFRQNIESIEERGAMVFCTLEMGIFGLFSEGQLTVWIRQIESENENLF
jgi:hypothetical protein